MSPVSSAAWQTQPDSKRDDVAASEIDSSQSPITADFEILARGRASQGGVKTLLDLDELASLALLAGDHAAEPHWEAARSCRQQQQQQQLLSTIR